MIEFAFERAQEDYFRRIALPDEWLGHAVARQVYDLPNHLHFQTKVFDPFFPGHRPAHLKKVFRQVADLPRIGVAEPSRE